MHGIMSHAAWRAVVLLSFLALLFGPSSASAQDAGSRTPQPSPSPAASADDVEGQHHDPAPPPGNVSATTQSATSITVSWIDLYQIGEYRLEQRTGSGGSWSPAGDHIHSTSYTVTGLKPGTTYCFRVFSYGDGIEFALGLGGLSATVWPTPTPTPTPTPPTPTPTPTPTPRPTPTPTSTPTPTPTPPPPPTITIARHSSTAANVSEGTEVRFTLTASRAPTSALAVNVSIIQTGSFFAGPRPLITLTQAEIAARSTTADLILQTENDAVDEANGAILCERGRQRRRPAAGRHSVSLAWDRGTPEQRRSMVKPLTHPLGL